MAETPDLKKVIDEMYLGNADISRLPNIFSEQYEAFQVAANLGDLGDPGYERQHPGVHREFSVQDLNAIQDSNEWERQRRDLGLSGPSIVSPADTINSKTRGMTNLVARRGDINGSSIRNNFEINWRRFAPMMAEEGLTADRVFEALYHVDEHAFAGNAEKILGYHDRPAMAAVMKVFEYIDPSYSDQIYDPIVGGLDRFSEGLVNHPRGSSSHLVGIQLPIGKTLTAEHLGRDYHPEELKAAKKYWKTPVEDSDLEDWVTTAKSTQEQATIAKNYGLRSSVSEKNLDKGYMPFSKFAKKANDFSTIEGNRNLPGTARATIPFVKAKHIPAILKIANNKGESVPGRGIVNIRTLTDLSSTLSPFSLADMASSHFLPSISPGLQDFLFKVPSAQAAVEAGLSPILARVINSGKMSPHLGGIQNFLTGIYGPALSHYFETRGKNEQSIHAGIKGLNDIVTGWLDAKKAVPSDAGVPETIATSGEFIGKKLTLRKATAEENRIGCHAINIKYSGGFCVADGVYRGEMEAGGAFGYLVTEEGTEGDVGFAITRGNGFFDWGYKEQNRWGPETAYVKEIQKAFPSSGDPSTPLQAVREAQSFYEIFRKFFATPEATIPHKVLGHVEGLLKDVKTDASGVKSTALERGKPLKFYDKGAAEASQKKIRKVVDEVIPKFKINAQTLSKFRKLKTLGIGIGIGAAAAAFPNVASAATGAAGGGGGLASTLITGAAIIGGIGVAAGLGVAAYKGAKAAKIPSVLGNIMSGPGGGTINRNTGSRIYNSGFIQGELDLTTRGFFAGIGSVINDFGLNRRISGFDQSGKASGFLDSFFGKALGSTGYVHPVYRAEEAFWQVANNLDDAYQGWKNYISTSASRSSGIAKFFHGARYSGFKLLDSVGDGWVNKQLVRMGGLSTMIAPALMGYGAIGDFKSGYRTGGVLGGVGNTALGIATGLVQNKVIAGALLNPAIGLTGGAVAAAAGYTAFKVFDVRNKGAQYMRSGRMGGISWNRGPTPGMSSSIGASVRQRAINAMENSRFSAMKAIGNESYMMSAPKARYSSSTAIYGTSSMLSY